MLTSTQPRALEVMGGDDDDDDDDDDHSVQVYSYGSVLSSLFHPEFFQQRRSGSAGFWTFRRLIGRLHR